MRFSAQPHSSLSPEEGGGAQAFLVSHSLSRPPFSLLLLLRPPPSLAGRTHSGCVQGLPLSFSQVPGCNDLGDLACLDTSKAFARRTCQRMGADWMVAEGTEKENMDRDGSEPGLA